MSVKIPKGQVLWTRYTDAKGKNLWLITSDLIRSKYYLYKFTGEKGDKLEKVKTAASPAELEDEIGMPV